MFGLMCQKNAKFELPLCNNLISSCSFVLIKKEKLSFSLFLPPHLNIASHKSQQALHKVKREKSVEKFLSFALVVGEKKKPKKFLYYCANFFE